MKRVDLFYSQDNYDLNGNLFQLIEKLSKMESHKNSDQRFWGHFIKEQKFINFLLLNL